MLINGGILIWVRRSQGRAERRYRTLAFEIGVCKGQIQRLIAAGRQAASVGLTPKFPVAAGDYRHLPATDRQPTPLQAN